jgi:orotidine-5'-phosphate decarboxylase
MADPARDHLALALDVDDIDVAVGLARRLEPWFSVVKVGLELFGSAGPMVVERLVGLDFPVFLDLKLHDIPTTVGRAARVLGRLGISYLTLHAQGGTEMLRAGVDGLAEGAAELGRTPATALGVTVLTSIREPGEGAVVERVIASAGSGCGGVVCAAADVAIAKRQAPELLAVVPGIRPAGTARDDQARPATPRDALSAGADLLVVGRAVTAADDPEAAAEALAGSLGTISAG